MEHRNVFVTTMFISGIILLALIPFLGKKCYEVDPNGVSRSIDFFKTVMPNNLESIIDFEYKGIENVRDSLWFQACLIFFLCLMYEQMIWDVDEIIEEQRTLKDVASSLFEPEAIQDGPIHQGTVSVALQVLNNHVKRLKNYIVLEVALAGVMLLYFNFVFFTYTYFNYFDVDATKMFDNYERVNGMCFEIITCFRNVHIVVSYGFSLLLNIILVAAVFNLKNIKYIYSIYSVYLRGLEDITLLNDNRIDLQVIPSFCEFYLVKYIAEFSDDNDLLRFVVNIIGLRRANNN